jgi:hypothetical protein
LSFLQRSSIGIIKLSPPNRSGITTGCKGSIFIFSLGLPKFAILKLQANAFACASRKKIQIYKL